MLTPFHMVIRAKQKSSLWQGEGTTFISQWFNTPSIGPRQESNPPPPALLPRALPTEHILPLYGGHLSTGNT